MPLPAAAAAATAAATVAAPKVVMTAGSLAGFGLNPSMMMLGAASLSGATVAKAAVVIVGSAFGLVAAGAAIGVVVAVGMAISK